MPAYFDSGFCVREPMWHGEGLVLDDYPTDWADARKKAGLEWEPELRRPYLPYPIAEFLPAFGSALDLACEQCGKLFGFMHHDECTLNPAEGPTPVELRCVTGLPDVAGLMLAETTLLVPAEGVKAVVRSDNRRTVGSVSDQFSLIFHGGAERESMENIIDAFSSAVPSLKFETAGAAKGGAVVWALMYLDEPFSVPGDERGQSFPFLALLNAHDGSGACKLTYTQVRVVCWNTFQMASAEGDAHGRQIVFRHAGDVGQRIEEAKEAIAGLRDETAAYVEFAEELTRLNVDEPAVARFLSEFLPSPRENGEVVSDRVHDNVERARGMFRRIYTDSITTEGIRGTGYGLLQASTEYLDHARAYRNRDTYLGRSILKADPAKAKAVQLIRGL